MGLSFHLASGGSHKEHINKNIMQYVNYLAKEIGAPPNLDKASALKKKLGVDFIVFQPESVFSTREGLFQAYKRDCLGEKKRLRCHGYKKISLGQYQIVVSHGKFWKRQPDEFTLGLLISALFILLILFVSYQFVRRTLNPIKEMVSATNDFSDGNWGRRIDLHRNDELGDLANTLDKMAERIERSMRSARELQVAISHELRSPLARMKLASEFISDEKIRSSLAEEIQLLDRMTANLLEQERLESRPELLKITVTELTGFIQMICEPFAERIELLPSKEEFNVSIDQDRMALCVRNIVDNAVKYSREKVVVEIFQAAEYYQIKVTDRGQGISKEDLNHVMEPFFRGDTSRTGGREAGGFGFGLSLCRSIVRAHGGTLMLASELERGTVVTVRVPVDERPRSTNN